MEPAKIQLLYPNLISRYNEDHLGPSDHRKDLGFMRKGKDENALVEELQRLKARIADLERAAKELETREREAVALATPDNANASKSFVVRANPPAVSRLEQTPASKKAEEDLLQQKEVLETILDNVPVMISFRAPDGTYRWLNRQFEETLGWTLEESRTHDLRAEFYPDPEIRQAAEEYIKRPQESWREWRPRRRDGTFLDSAWVNVALSDGSTIGIGIDIGEQKRDARHNEVLGRLVTRLAASADIKNMIDAVEEGTSQLLSWDAHYFAVKRPHEGAFRVLHTVDTIDGQKRIFLEDNWELSDFSNKLKQLLEGKPLLLNRPPGVAEPTYTRFGDRSRASASLMFVPIRSGKSVIGILSAQSYTHFRYGEADLTLFQRVADLVAPALERAYAEEALRRAHDDLETRVRERTADLARANELLVAEITDRKRAEEEREQLQAQLQHALKMEAVGRLSGGIAHDFNNLLTVILGNSQVALMLLQEKMAKREVGTSLQRSPREQLADTRLPDAARDVGGPPMSPVLFKVVEALVEIEQATQRAALLTSRLLTFSRKHVTNQHVLDAGSVIQGIAGMLRRLIREDIALEIVSAPGEHLIHADTMQIEQTLLNLAVNAVDAMPDGGTLTIEITDVTLDGTHCTENGEARTGPHVQIAVIDTGLGMDQHTLNHLFEPFFTTKPFGQGTGLGLATCYGIVKQSGGHITVESQPGKGSAFKLYFPAAQGEISRSPEPPRPEWERGDATILLCEDEDSLRRLASSILTECGYRVIESRNGEEAVRAAAEYKGCISLLITDLIMPGMKGDNVAASIKKVRPRMQALFMSGYTSDSLSAECIAQSGHDFLQKPFTPEALLRRVRDILNKTQ